MIRMRLLPRGRLSRQLLIMGLAALGTGLFTAHLVVVHQENRLIYRIVQQRLDSLAEQARAAAGQPGVPRSSLGHIALSRDVLAAIPAPLQGLQPGYHLLSGTTEIEHVLVRDEGPARLYAVYADGLHHQRVQAHQRILLGLFVALGAGLVVIAKWWAGTLIGLRPGMGRRLEGGARSPSLAAPPGTPDERAELASFYGDYQESAMATQQREREFIANVGHELRTPITLLLTGCELLEENASLDPAARRQVQRMATAAEHMSEAVRSFMILAREGSLGQADAVELRACVLEALEPHNADIAQRQLSLRVHVGADAVIEANREALFVVVSNLVKNAVKYTERGGISIHHLGHTLYVADTGCGIDDGDLPQLFQPFFRARRAAESGQPGLGLGLAIVKRICDFYGWTVTVRSTVGQGTTMSVEFSRPHASLF